MATKCTNCGASIPGSAGFCPSCGAPRAVEQPAAQAQPMQTAPQPIKSAQSGVQGFIDFSLSLKIMLIGIFIALLIAWITKTVNVFLIAGTNAYNALRIVNFTFMAGAGGLLLLGGLLNDKFNIYLRAALMVTGGVFLALNL